MKRFLAWLLLAAALAGLCGCAAQVSPPETAEIETSEAVTTAPETQSTTQETEPPALESSLFLKVSAITFSLVGESEDIYLGLVPRELVIWESDDPAVVSVENGVLTANSVGTTIVRAAYRDQVVECTAGCLAETQEELDSLEPEILSAPKRMPPKVDMEEPCTYFDNAAIMGDSITYFLWQAESKNNYLGDMLFVTRQGVSVIGLVQRYKNLYFQGREMNVEDIAAKCKAERLYIALGCLDYQFSAGRKTLMDNWKIMLDRIAKKSPELEIVIISNIPCFTEDTKPSMINDLIAENNDQLRKLAADRGYGFLDLGYYIQDHYGRMPAVYCKDEYHMNAEGSLAWMQIMRYYAQYEREGGTLS